MVLLANMGWKVVPKLSSERVVAAVARGCICLFAWSLASAGSALAQGARPNVLVVLFDDVGFMDFGAYGSDSRTPNIDALAKRGVMLCSLSLGD